ncbi:MAG: CDP-alcohol phosphatidyltransferase family protein [Clostridia bacterium]|nr:CDP-alcohol phosphatidyltransferase family protein [Clostridia bacterium]
MNLPNKLTMARILLVPLFVVFYFLPFDFAPYVAVALFVVAACTDFLDGYIARKYNLVTDLGKLLDPIADKTLVTAALFCVVATNPLQYGAGLAGQIGQQGQVILAVCGIIVLARELIISAVRQIAATKGVVIQANVYGKIKTITQDVCLPILIVLNGAKYLNNLFFDVVWWVGFALLIVSTAITILSGVVYLVQNKKVFWESK